MNNWRTGQECVGPLLHKARKRGVDLANGAGGEDFDLLSNDRRCRLHLFDHGLGNTGAVRIDEHDEAHDPGSNSCKRLSSFPASSTPMEAKR
jgi:hypothetical protein